MSKEFKDLSAVVNAAMQPAMQTLPKDVGIICIAVRFVDEENTDTSIATNLKKEAVTSILGQLAKTSDADNINKTEKFVQNPRLN